MSPLLLKVYCNNFPNIQPDKSFIIAPMDNPYPYKKDVWIYNLKEIIKMDL